MKRFKTIPSVFYRGEETDPSRLLLELCKYNREDDPVPKLQELRSKGANPNVKEDALDRNNKQRSPIHLAAKNGNDVVLKYLLDWADHQDTSPNTVDFNITDNKGRTALHYASKTCCSKSESEGYIRCIKMLMDTDGFHLNLPDEDGYTAVTYAAQRRHKDRLLALLNHPIGFNLNLKLSPADSELCADAAIKRYYPDVSHLLGRKLHIASSADNATQLSIQLLKTLLDDKLNDFKKALALSPKKNPVYGEPYHISLIELACSINRNNGYLKALLDAGVDPNVTNAIHKKPLLHLAVEKGRSDILRTLLECSRTDIHIQDKYQRNALHYAAKQQVVSGDGVGNLLKCITLLLNWHHRRNVPEIDINSRDIDGNTALHLAGRYGHEETVLTLLRNEASLLAKNKEGDYALTSIDVDILRQFLDEQVDCTNNSVEDFNFFVELRYAFLKSSEDSGMTALLLMSQRQHLRELLKHPVMCSFLDLRWRRVRAYFIINIVFYAVFVFLVTAQVIIVDKEAQENSATGVFLTGLVESRGVWIILFALIIFLSARELVQFALNPVKYVKNPENYLECALFVCVVLHVYTDAISSGVKHHLSPIIILAAWTELMIMTGRLPILSVQLEMSRKVTMTFLQYIPWFALAILAFALSFFSLFRNAQDADENMFINPAEGMFKTVLMMTGEYDLSKALLHATPITSHIIILIFVFMLAIVMLNLLSGLAVGDTNSIREMADILSLVHRVKLVIFMEDSLSAILRKAKSPEQMWVYPNRERSADTDIPSIKLTMDKTMVEEALGIVMTKKKAKSKSHWNVTSRPTRHKNDINLPELLDQYERRLEAMESMMKQLITLNGGNTSLSRQS